MITFNRDPFSHFYVKNVISDAKYTELLSLVPSSTESYQKAPYTGHRYQKILPSNMWRIIENTMFHYITLCLKEYNMENETKYITISPTLLKDSKGYSFEPHTDTIDRKIIFMYYIPVDNSKSAYGTSMYEPKNKQFTYEDIKGTTHPRENFNLIETAPYLPNTMLGFGISNKSFHGFELMDVDYIRNSIIVIVNDSRKVEERAERLQSGL